MLIPMIFVQLALYFKDGIGGASRHPTKDAWVKNPHAARCAVGAVGAGMLGAAWIPAPDQVEGRLFAGMTTGVWCAVHTLRMEVGIGRGGVVCWGRIGGASPTLPLGGACNHIWRAGMDRRDFLQRVGVGSLSVLGLGRLGGTRASEQRPLNVLLFTADDLDFGSVGCFGGKVRGLTPCLDAFAAEGMRFERAHVTVAICRPIARST